MTEAISVQSLLTVFDITGLWKHIFSWCSVLRTQLILHLLLHELDELSLLRVSEHLLLGLMSFLQSGLVLLWFGTENKSYESTHWSASLPTFPIMPWNQLREYCPRSFAYNIYNLAATYLHWLQFTMKVKLSYYSVFSLFLQMVFPHRQGDHSIKHFLKYFLSPFLSSLPLSPCF